MKDIYSPLEIDEEWDQRAPQMGGPDAATATVDVAAGETPPTTETPVQPLEVHSDQTPQPMEMPIPENHVDVMGDGEEIADSMAKPEPTEAPAQNPMPAPEATGDSAEPTAETSTDDSSAVAIKPGEQVAPQNIPESMDTMPAPTKDDDSETEGGDSADNKESEGTEATITKHDAVEAAEGDEEAADEAEDNEAGNLKVSPVAETEVDGEESAISTEAGNNEVYESAVDSTVESLQGNVTSLKDAKEKIDSRVAAANSRESAAQAELDKAQKKADEEKAAAQTDAETAQKESDSLDAQIKDLEEMINKLREQRGGNLQLPEADKEAA